MVDLTFWLHMNDEYSWRWFCSRADGTVMAMSTRAFFSLAEAEGALATARAAIGETALAA